MDPMHPKLVLVAKAELLPSQQQHQSLRMHLLFPGQVSLWWTYKRPERRLPPGATASAAYSGAECVPETLIRSTAPPR